MKESWNTPELTVYGAVEELTQQSIGGKVIGKADGFKITSITNPSTGDTININPGINIGS